MGRTMAQLGVCASLSSNGSGKDARDAALWADLYRKITELVEDPEYQDIIPMMT